MKKVKKTVIPKRTIKEHTREKVVVVCDICKDEARVVVDGKPCMVCKRDVCASCSNYDPENMGDYPDYYCEICYGLRFEKHKHVFEKLEENYDKDIEKATEEIRRLSLKQES